MNVVDVYYFIVVIFELLINVYQLIYHFNIMFFMVMVVVGWLVVWFIGVGEDVGEP